MQTYNKIMFLQRKILIKRNKRFFDNYQDHFERFF
jgi:hypothetical protein